FCVVTGGRLVSELAVRVTGVDVPAQQLMGGLFGRGLRSLGAAGVATGTSGHASAALVGGGIVFVLALLLPGLVYLRGCCAVYLAVTGPPGQGLPQDAEVLAACGGAGAPATGPVDASPAAPTPLPPPAPAVCSRAQAPSGTPLDPVDVQPSVGDPPAGRLP
ncbi:MAG TPA: hypothetical protein VEZ89_05735, partial [Rubrivivax sp.]|nr:hypothetical protein [Rubrivivax sp.]